MSTHEISLDLGPVDLSKLETEEDFRAEARRLLPAALVQAGEAMARLAWEGMQKAFKGVPGMRANSSASDKNTLIRSAGQKYLREASAADRRKYEDHIVEQLRQRKGG